MDAPAAAGGGTLLPRLVVVTGSGRSGTSTIAGVLKTLGLHVPQPEVGGTRANPRGHFEPQWAVDFQTRLLRRVQVRLSDARPGAFAQTGRVGLRPWAQDELRGWLRDQMAVGTEVVVKDPRNSWFLPMWQEAGRALGTSPGFVTMLRHPAEVVGSKNTYYYKKESAELRRVGETSRIASWVNVSLFSEHPTRTSPRVFLRYTDLLADWRPLVKHTAESLDLSLRHGLAPDLADGVDAFVDPGLHRVRVTWDDLDVPASLQELAEDVWQQLNRLADSPTGRDDEAEKALDTARQQYRRMYDDAYALVSSSVDAAGRAAVRRANRGRRQQTAALEPGAVSSPGERARRVLARGRRLAGRARRGLRARARRLVG